MIVQGLASKVHSSSSVYDGSSSAIYDFSGSEVVVAVLGLDYEAVDDGGYKVGGWRRRRVERVADVNTTRVWVTL